MPQLDRTAWWTRRAIQLAWFTIAYNLIEGVVAIGFGLSDDSIALFGFGLDSLIEVASAGLVLWRFREERGAHASGATERERFAARGIGILLVTLAVIVTAGAVSNLVRHVPPETAIPGMIVSLVSLSFMFLLWRSKTRAARALDSATVRSDAACSLACIQLSLVLLAGSALYRFLPTLWWADSAAAVALAILIGREGWTGIAASRRPDFSGGCGCH
ncbi:MAG: cation transporter [Candidatus Eisenbacteria bacterium]|uniref:Cation transporter n=1 Tax=Eiseniibacteriota bacterium TaxID=2212470 RepID=A0A956RQI0_UNCEI|nr:cation transporter [Candidatus Eisenbacteria bacterium]